MKKRYYVLIAISLIILIPLLTVLLLSPPGLGKRIAKEHGVAYPAIIAHRGASYHAPESTREAYLLAIEMGADYLEADLQRTKDGKIIVFHDDDLLRTTDAHEIFTDKNDILVKNFSYEELVQLDVGSWFNEAYPERAKAEYKGLKIITLEELVDIAKNGGVGIYLETKSADNYPGIEKEIVSILEEKDFLEKVIFQSFSLDSLREFKQLKPEIPRVLLINRQRGDEEGFKNIIEEAKDYIHGVGPVGHLGLPQNTGKAHREGLIVHHYTINDPMEMRLLYFFGSDGFFTDRVDMAVKILR